MLLDNTKHKLDEASFFLDKVKSSLTNPIELSFYLSAGRSVTWSMQKEFGDNSRYLKWYDEKKQEMRNDEIFTIFKNLRNITVKEGKLEFKRNINVSVNEEIGITDSVGFKVIRNGEVIRESKSDDRSTKESKPEKNSNTVSQTNKVEVLLDNAPGREGIELCDHYLNKLKTLVGRRQNDK